jgi:hypothetical protein
MAKVVAVASHIEDLLIQLLSLLAILVVVAESQRRLSGLTRQILLNAIKN